MKTTLFDAINPFIALCSVCLLLGTCVWADTIAQEQQGPRTLAYWNTMSADEQHRSSLYNRFSRRHSIVERGVLSEVFTGTPFMSGTEPPALPSLRDLLKELSCRADLVVSGSITGSKSMPNKFGTFIFTDYYLDNTTAIRSTDDKSVPSTITVMRPGGEIVGPDFRARIVLQSWPTLRVGDSYLLFLNSIPGSAAYKSSGAEAVLRISNGQTKALVGLANSDRNLVHIGVPLTEMNSMIRNVNCADGSVQ